MVEQDWNCSDLEYYLSTTQIKDDPFYSAVDRNFSRPWICNFRRSAQQPVTYKLRV